MLFCSSLSAPIKLVPLSHLITLTLPLLAINLLRACMKASVSILLTVSMCIALHDKQVKIDPYLLSSLLPSLTISVYSLLILTCLTIKSLCSMYKYI